MASSARIDELRQKFDENPRRYFAPLANEYRKIGDLDQAIFICQEYLPQQPGHMSGHIVYGQALFEAGRIDEARAVFETALTLDPENLIALRHLGDIATRSGDTTAARSWYQRVLEADPRNEEIATLLNTLLSEPEPAAGERRATVPTPAAPAPAFPGRRSAPDAEQGPQALQGAASAPATTGAADNAGDSHGMVIERASEAPTPVVALPAHQPTPVIASPVQHTAPEPPPAAPPATAPPAPPPAQPRRASISSPGGHELFDISDITIGGESLVAKKPLSRMIDPGPEELALAIDPTPPLDLLRSTDPTPPTGVSAAIDAAPPADLETFETLAAEAALFEADPLAITGFQDDALTGDTIKLDAAPEPPLLQAEPSPQPGIAPELVRAPEPALAPTQAPPPPSFEFARETPPGGPIVDASEPAATVAPEPTFVTETMAELYLQQGHRREAIGIFRQLIDLHPDNRALRDRLEALEAPETPVDQAIPPAPSGPSIREQLRDLLWNWNVRTRASTATAGPDAAPGRSLSANDLAWPGLALSPSAPTPPLAQRGVVGHDGEGSVDALFPDAVQDRPNLVRATLLAEGYRADTAIETPLRGMPAHRATGELSLEQVFGGSTQSSSGGKRPSAQSAATGFSFDQLFAGGAASDATGATQGAMPADAAPSDDVEGFNAWLQGLRKT